MSIPFFTGSETGDLSEYSVTNGTLSVQNTVARNGGYALRVNPTTTNLAYAKLSTSTPMTTTYHRFYFRYGTKPSNGQEAIFSVNTTTNSGPLFVLVIDNSGRLKVYNNALTASGNGTTVLNQDTWYCIECKVTKGATSTTGSYELKINGATELTGNGNFRTGTVDCSSVILGRAYTLSKRTINFYYDDYICSDTGYLGEGTCVLLKPNSIGTYDDWLGSGGNKWDEVNQFPNDADTSYLTSQGINSAQTFGFEDISDINHVHSALACVTLSGTGDVVVMTDTESDVYSISGGYNTIFKSLTNLDVNNTEMGCISLTAPPIKMTSCGLMVDYSPLIDVFPLPHHKLNTLVRR